MPRKMSQNESIQRCFDELSRKRTRDSTKQQKLLKSSSQHRKTRHNKQTELKLLTAQQIKLYAHTNKYKQLPTAISSIPTIPSTSLDVPRRPSTSFLDVPRRSSTFLDVPFAYRVLHFNVFFFKKNNYVFYKCFKIKQMSLFFATICTFLIKMCVFDVQSRQTAITTHFRSRNVTNRNKYSFSVAKPMFRQKNQQYRLMRACLSQIHHKPHSSRSAEAPFPRPARKQKPNSHTHPEVLKPLTPRPAHKQKPNSRTHPEVLRSAFRGQPTSKNQTAAIIPKCSSACLQGQPTNKKQTAALIPKC